MLKLKTRTPGSLPHLVSYMLDEGQSGWRFLVTDGSQRTASHTSHLDAIRAWNTGDITPTVTINDAIALASIPLTTDD